MAEKGFELELVDAKVELKRLLPRFEVACFCTTSFSGSNLVPVDALVFAEDASGILIPRIALIVPSFFRQALRLQLKM